MEFIIQLLNTPREPYLFLPLLFVYSILVAVVLPTPVEVALIPLLTQPTLYGVAAVTIGLGKAAGSWMMFLLGIGADKLIAETSAKNSHVKRFVDWFIRFVSKTKYVGLFAPLALPFMSDTVPLYVYSLFNNEGAALSARDFIFTNFLAGVNRALILLSAIVALGIDLLLWSFRIPGEARIGLVRRKAPLCN